MAGSTSDINQDFLVRGANDLLVAAQALSLGHVLVTDNEHEFARVDGLRCENWLR